MQHLSLVIPAYNEEDNIPVLYNEILQALEPLSVTFEILFINDKSSDGTEKAIQELAKKDDRVHGFSLQRNTRKSGALELGFHEARGDIVITLDADLQDDPNEIPKLLAAIENGADVAIGWRANRLDSIGKRLPSLCVNTLSNIMLGQHFHDMNCGFKAYRKEAIGSIIFYGSLFRFIPHLLQRNGFHVEEVAIQHRQRKYGVSKFSWRHRLRGVFDLCTVFFIVKYGDRPLHFFGAVGFAIFSCGFASSSYLFSIWIRGTGVGTRPLLFFSVLLLIVGVQIASIGLIGELIIYTKSRRESNLQHKTLTGTPKSVPATEHAEQLASSVNA